MIRGWALRRACSLCATAYLGPRAPVVEGEHELFGFLTAEANAIGWHSLGRDRRGVLTSAAEVDRLA
jgi:hypothetical protein